LNPITLIIERPTTRSRLYLMLVEKKVRTGRPPRHKTVRAIRVSLEVTKFLLKIAPPLKAANKLTGVTRRRPTTGSYQYLCGARGSQPG
jgi:hypothetical protein